MASQSIIEWALVLHASRDNLATDGVNARGVMLINVSGQDQPGLMAGLMGCFVEHDAQILDIGQAVIHDDLALGILVRINSPSQHLLTDEITRCVSQAGAMVRISDVSESDYQEWLAVSGQPRFILTILTHGNGAAPMHAVSQLTHRFGLNIDTVRRLTDRRRALPDGRLGVEMRVRGPANHIGELQSELMAASEQLNFDFSVQEDTVFRRNRRLVAFDMDSTLIDAEVIDELAIRHGVGEQVSAITADAMAGRIDFQESFRRRAKLLKGMPLSVLDEVASSVQLNTGAHRLLRALQHFGYKTAVISGGFQYVGEHLQAQLGIDYVYANTLQISDGYMTGEVQGDIVDAQRKAQLLRQTADMAGISLAQTIAIGDGANDLPMLTAAGLGVAFHAKSVVKESAGHAISNFGLDAVLYLIGFSDRDIDQALGTARQ